MTVCGITSTGIIYKKVNKSITNTNGVKKNRAKNSPISFSTSLLLAICLLHRVPNHIVKTTTFPIKLISTSTVRMARVRYTVMEYKYPSTLNTNPVSNVIMTNIHSNNKRDRSLQGSLLEKQPYSFVSRVK